MCGCTNKRKTINGMKKFNFKPDFAGGIKDAIPAFAGGPGAVLAKKSMPVSVNPNIKKVVMIGVPVLAMVFSKNMMVKLAAAGFAGKVAGDMFESSSISGAYTDEPGYFVKRVETLNGNGIPGMQMDYSNMTLNGDAYARDIESSQGASQY